MIETLPGDRVRHGWTAGGRSAISRLPAGPGSAVLDERPPTQQRSSGGAERRRPGRSAC